MFGRMNCPVCQSHSTRLVHQLGALTVRRCTDCTFHFAAIDDRDRSAPVATDAGFYTRIIASFAEQRALARKILPARIELYARLLGRPVKSVLEIGCATGVLAEPFGENGVQYTGIEIEPALAEIAQKKTQRPILSQDFMNHTGGPYDVIFASQVLEHVPNPVPFLRKARGLCGLLHLDVPNHDSLVLAVRKRFRRRDFGAIQPPYHLLAYNKRSLGTALDLAGFAPVVLKNVRGDDRLLGQMQTYTSPLKRLAYSVSDIFGMGGLLTTIARPG